MRLITKAQTLAPVLLFALAISSVAFGQDAQSTTERLRSERLTRALIALNLRYRTARPDERSTLAKEMLSTAAERQEALASMLERDPADLLRVAVAPEVRASLPAEVGSYVEQHVELEGILEVLHEDYTWGARVRYYLHSGGTRLSLHFASNPPGLLTGARMRVRGVRVNNTLALESGATSVQAVSAPALTNTFGEQRTLVLLVNFQEKPIEPYTLAHAQSIVFTMTSNFDREASFQQTWLAGDVFGWYTLAMDSTVCDTSQIASLAKQAATAAGVNVSLYTRYVYAFSNACPWWGQGTTGGNPSQAWINGGFQFQVVGHEMGHNFGLYHAHSLDCGSSPTAPPCTAYEYGDSVDVMGNTSGHFNSFMKERLGWLEYGSSPPIITVQTDGTYWLEPFESTPGGGAKTLKILKSSDSTTGARTWYYVEFRQAIGFDAFLGANSNVLNGVVIHSGSESNANSSYLLDMTPETTSWEDPALGVGKNFTDTTAGVTVTTVSANSAGASVAVSFSPPACSRSSPSVALAPTQTQAGPGTTVSYTVSVTNTDSTGCAAAMFNLASAVPNGWSASFASPSLTITQGARALTTMQVTAASTAAEGSYTVGAAAIHDMDTTKTGSASAIYMVMASLAVQVLTDRPSYTRNQTVHIKANVSAGYSAAAGAPVAFKITKPDGSVVSAAASTDSNGVATYALRLRNKDRAGTYQATASASLSGMSGTGTASFAVK